MVSDGTWRNVAINERRQFDKQKCGGREFYAKANRTFSGVNINV